MRHAPLFTAPDPWEHLHSNNIGLQRMGWIAVFQIHRHVTPTAEAWVVVRLAQYLAPSGRILQKPKSQKLMGSVAYHV